MVKSAYAFGESKVMFHPLYRYQIELHIEEI